MSAREPPLFGRDGELTVIDDLLGAVDGQGAALVVRGDAGIGKSALLLAAKMRAETLGYRVLSTAGVQSETNLPFAGLHQLLVPTLGDVERLPRPQSQAVKAAFGMFEGTPPEIFLIGLATLQLLSDASSSSPIILIVEDAHWLDRLSANVVAFVARRLARERLLMLIAIREGYKNPFTDLGLAQLHLQPLDDEAASALLTARYPDLRPGARARIIEESEGNPLALVELPRALSDRHPDELPSLARLPLTTRVERAFLARAADLGEDSRTILLVASLSDTGQVTEVIEAARTISDDTVEGALTSALDTGLIWTDAGRIHFRHPLARLAIQQATTATQRIAAHAALAGVLRDQPERRALHRAASILGKDDEAASELEAAAISCRKRGAIVSAVEAFERAAQLTTDGVRGGSRILMASQMAFELGRPDLVIRLLQQAEALDLTERDRARAIAIREMATSPSPGDSLRVRDLVAAAKRMNELGEHDLVLNLLLVAAVRCWWADAGPDERLSVVEAAVGAGASYDDPKLLDILAFASPIDFGTRVIERLTTLSPKPEDDPRALRLLGLAAVAVGDFARAEAALRASIAGLRTQGRLGLMVEVQLLHANAAIEMGDLSVALPEIEEALYLASDTRQPLWVAAAKSAKAKLAALRGDFELAEDLAGEAEQIASTIRASVVIADACVARGLSALGQRKVEEAFSHFGRLHDSNDPAFRLMERWWNTADYAEAAAQCGRQAEALKAIEELSVVTDKTASPWVSLQMMYAKAVLAEEGTADKHYTEAIRNPALGQWRPLRARLQLAYGGWLRRRRRIAEARPLLRTARDTFDAIGLIPWGEHARRELRATGETSRTRSVSTWEKLSPQELQIAKLAAEGLTNREIGQQLYLSHRTVSSHLYRIFPKLGITSRAQLHEVLANTPA